LREISPLQGCRAFLALFTGATLTTRTHHTFLMMIYGLLVHRSMAQLKVAFHLLRLSNTSVISRGVLTFRSLSLPASLPSPLMELTPTTPALPKNIHMSYEYELIVCQSDKEAIDFLIKKLALRHF
jgi:hypothetical protein